MGFVAVVAFLLPFMAGRRIVEVLRSPVAVVGWSEEALLLADGRPVKLPEIRVLPVRSEGLSRATRRGVELGQDGRVYGLVRVHHWCGNDPVREHIARVDLSYFLAFLGEGQLVAGLDPELQATLAQSPGGRFSAYGWDVGEYVQFRGWCRLADDLAGSQALRAGSRPVPPPTPIPAQKAGKPLP
jgi:hypothetical protein